MIESLGDGEVAGRLALAMALSAAVGLEREIHGAEAGLRTHTLVGLGAALFTIAGADTVAGDPTRVAAQVVSGIGFIGAGAIINRRGAVRGLTTAASLWAVAAIGLAAGAGSYVAVGLTSAAILVFLWPLRGFERRFFDRRPHALVVHTEAWWDLEALRGSLAAFRADYLGFRLAGERRVVTLRVRANRRELDAIVERLSREPAVLSVELSAREREDEPA